MAALLSGAERLLLEQVERRNMQANERVAQEATRLHKKLRLKEKEIKQLWRGLRRKEAALTKTTALLVLPTKPALSSTP